ncbi:MAG: hypothetical protein FJ319_02005 [SAR202 cluster bacterium]|nr:hypothetical protein [SAR202 cluster bacterium]
MATIGSGKYTYEITGQDWGKLLEGWSYKEATAVAVDAKDNVFVFGRGKPSVIVMNRDGEVLRSWGDGLFTNPHGITIGPDGAVYCVDVGDHTVRKFTPEGKLLMTLGTPGKATMDKPFNRPSHAAVDPRDGSLYVSDGYNNARVHKFSPDGKLLHSWGRSGTDPGEFNIVHNVAVDREGWVYVADRENHRVQVFDSKGKFESQWVNLAPASCIYVDTRAEPVVYVGEFYAGLPESPSGYGNWTQSRLGPRLTVLDRKGKVLARVGDRPMGLETGQFVAPHGIAVDSKGDVYVAEVSFSIYGSKQTPPRTVRSFQKLVRKG